MAQKPDLWMPLYIADYIKDTQHFTTREHGAYLLILMHCWTNDGRLPLDPERLRLIARMTPAEWKSSWPVLSEKLPAHGDERRNPRVDKELGKAKGMVTQRSEAGKLSAEKRWGKREGNDNGNGGVNEDGNEAGNEPITKSLRKNAPSQSQPQKSLPSPSPRPSPPPAQGSRASRAPRSIAPGFPDFWVRYPRKTARASAEKAWQALVPNDELRVTMLAALEDQKQSRQWSDPQFIPHPATWINQRRWEDEVPRETEAMSANDRAAQTWLEGSTPAIEQ